MKKKIVAILTAMVLAVLSLFVFVGCGAGQDGKDFDLYSVYQQLVDRGEFEGTFAEFVQQYLDVEVNVDENGTYSTAINSSLAQIVSIEIVGECERYVTTMGGRPSYKDTTDYIFGAGSGVIYQLDREKGDAYIITNCHVIYDNYDTNYTFTDDSDETITYFCRHNDKPLKYYAYLYGMEGMEEYNDYAIPCTIVGYSMSEDIAVLKVEGSEVLKNSMAQAVTIGNSDEAAVGDSVFLIGNPLGYGIAATSGILSVENEQVAVYAADNQTILTLRAMRTDASANHGNSGGGLFDANGRLLGILFAGNNTDGTQGVNNVLPINRVKGIVDSILHYCNDGTVQTTKKVILGVTPRIDSVEQIYDNQTNKFTFKETVVVKEIGMLTPAWGKLQSGDVIISLTLGNISLDVMHAWQISDFLWRVREGDAVSVTVKRGGKEITEQITVGTGDFTPVV